MKSSPDMFPTSSPKNCSNPTLYTQAVSLLPREKSSKITVAFIVFLVVALLNSWWFLSLVVDRQQFDIFKLPATNNGSTTESIIGVPTGGSTSNETGKTRCDFAEGRWVPDTRPPLYTNETCRYIHYSQDCMKNGRPDRGYLYWRWQPTYCELPLFDAHLFLQSVKHKKMMFIGDSIARNHMQSLLCALAQVEDPQNVYFDVKEKEATWKFQSYNFTLANNWSPFLVNHTFEHNIYHIHLDIPDVLWSTPLVDYDIAIISTGYWYFRPSIYYMNNTILGTNPHSGVNLTIFDKLPAMQIAWDTVLNHMLNKFKGIAIMRTVTVPHFESGTWSSGGACNRTQPIFDPLMQEPLPWMSDAMTQVQKQVFKRAIDHMQANNIESKKLRLLNITYSSFLRPDGHPNSYRIQTPGEPRSDCLHWCLPGPIDMWNQILMHMILH